MSGVLAALPQWGVDAGAVDFAHGCLLPAGSTQRCLVLNFTRCRSACRNRAKDPLCVLVSSSGLRDCFVSFVYLPCSAAELARLRAGAHGQPWAGLLPQGGSGATPQGGPAAAPPPGTAAVDFYDIQGRAALEVGRI